MNNKRVMATYLVAHDVTEAIEPGDSVGDHHQAALEMANDIDTNMGAPEDPDWHLCEVRDDVDIDAMFALFIKSLSAPTEPTGDVVSCDIEATLPDGTTGHEAELLSELLQRNYYLHAAAELYRMRAGSIWEDHPDHGPSDWRYEVENNYTRLGYWEWVVMQMEQAEELGEDGDE